MSLKKTILVIVSSIIVTTVISTTAKARSVYVIADTRISPGDSPIIQAYRIQDSNLVWQADYNCVHLLAIGIAIDAESEYLFVTHEKYKQYPGDIIEIINAKTMAYVDTVTATGASNLAGIVVNSAKNYLNKTTSYNIMVE